jgi:peptide/nickel transport system substrate-binding protein
MELGPVARRRFLKMAAMSSVGVLVTSCASTSTTASGSSTASAAPSTGAATTAAQTSAATSSAAATTSAASSAPAAASSTAQQITLANAATTAASASASGKYNEAPQLAALVKAGKLPAVDQRLPANPRVIKPLQSVGQYGGVWHRAYSGLSDRWGPTKLIEDPLARWEAPDVNTIQVVPNFVEKWEQNSDATEFTFHMRQGLKWSDGQPVTIDDAKFWFEDVQQNKQLVTAPSFVISQQVNGKAVLATVAYPDASTIRVTYQRPFPLLPIQIAKNGGAGPAQPAFFIPSHYLKQFMPKYGDQAKIDALVKQKGLGSWTDLWGKAGDMQGPIAFWMLNPDLPVINAWKIQAPPPADPMVMVRNPYYWMVDTAGNQLPYIDQINHNLYQDVQVLNLWIASGKIDAQMRGLSAGDYTFYKQNEQKGGYKTLNWRAASTGCFYVNLNCPDPVLAKLFDTPDFRQALNISINREEINQLVYNGLGTARQYSPVKGSPEYDAGMTKAWVEYDVAKANTLMDGLGLKQGSGGIRQRPDGKPLEMIMEHTALQGSPDLEVNNLVVKYWAAIGVKIDLKYDERALYEQRVHDALPIATAGFGWDRSSVVKADPGRFLGTIDDGPWAPAYGHWYAKSPYKQVQPPDGHPITKIWALWDQTQVEPDEAKRNALFQQLIGIHKATPFAMGTVGELVVPFVVKTNFMNAAGGYIDDDTLRDIGLIYPAQMYMKS